MRRTRDTVLVKANAILVADLHLSEETPVSRIDDYHAAQIKKLKFLQELSNQNNNCPVICSGDVFDRWKSSPWLLSMVYKYLPRPFYAIPGNHDLPLHSMENFDKAALSLLAQVDENIHIILDGKMKLDGRKILILHQMVWHKRKPPWSQTSVTDTELLEQYDGAYDLILTGDNHISFTANTEKTILVNPGSMMRKNVDQADAQPRCFLYYTTNTTTNSITPVFFPIDHNVHNTERIMIEQNRDERISAYIERMKKDWEIGLSFEKSLQAFFDKNNTSERVRKIICNQLEQAKV